MGSIKKYVAEFIGTMVLVTFGCGVAVASNCNGMSFDAAYIGTALAFGLSIVAMAYSIGNVSGCHVNPAVSLAMLVRGNMTTKEFCGYVIAQVLGGICGAGLIGYLFGGNGYGANSLYLGDALISCVIEAVLTFVFVLTVLGATDGKFGNGKVTGLVIGLSLTLVHLLGIYFTGTSVNPARSLGPALFAGGTALSSVWVFIVAPLIGGFLAALAYNALSPKESK